MPVGPNPVLPGHEFVRAESVRGGYDEEQECYAHGEHEEAEEAPHDREPEGGGTALNGMEATLQAQPFILGRTLPSEFLFGDASRKDHRIEGKLVAPEVCVAEVEQKR